MSGDVNFNVSPGIVSVCYFVILDLAILTLFDSVLSRIAASLYYRQIRRGKPLIVRSADILGLSSYLIGSYWAPFNIVTYIIKVILLICIIFIDLGIDSNIQHPHTQSRLTSIFKFDPSPEAWDIPFFHIVERRFEQCRICRFEDERAEKIIFYAIAFNLSGGELDSELSENRSKEPVDDSSIQCLRKGLVDEKDELPIATIMGCSQFRTTSCRNGTVVETSDVDIILNASSPYDIITIDYGVIDGVFSLHSFDEVARQYFPPSYENVSMSCVRNRFGVRTIFKMYESCLVMARYNKGKNTLIEMWEYNRTTSTLRRNFPGPVFQGNLQYSSKQIVLALRETKADLNWLSFSATLVADGVIYEQRSLEVRKFGESRIVTTIPWTAIILSIVLGTVGIAARIVIMFVLNNDDAIQLNTVDGLSSIGREEREPTGRSMATGKYMVLGLTNPDGAENECHFGPLRSREVGMKRSDSVVR